MVFIGSTSATSFQNYQPKIAKLVKNFHEQHQLPSLVFTLNADNNIYHYAKGFADIYDKVLIQSDTLFEASSITKTFIAVLILKLANIGSLNINDSLVKYLPCYTNWKHITIKQLMNMTSGIYNFYVNEDFRHCIFGKSNTVYTPKELIKLSHQEPLRFTPGQKWHYSNTNYLVLGEILKNVTGRDIANLLQEYVLHPYKFENTYYSEDIYSNEIMAKKAHGYYKNIYSENEPLLDVTNISPSNFGATGSMLMNDIDLQKLVALLFRSQKILTNSELKEMLNNTQIPDDGGRLPNSGYGAGVFTTHHENHGLLIWNVGLSTGYSFSFLYMPERNAIITMQTNQLEGDGLNIKNHSILFPHGELLREVMNVITNAD